MKRQNYFPCYVIAAFTWQVASGIPYWPHVRAIPSGSSTLASNSWTSKLKFFKVNFWLLLWPCPSPTFLFWGIHSFVILKLTLLHVLTLVRIVCICHVISRGPSCRCGGASFNTKVKTLHEVLATLVESIPGFFCWFHKGLTNPVRTVLLPDGVHLNTLGQYLLYRSYRGAILKALSLLHNSTMP